MIEFVPSKITEIGKQGLLLWLLKRLKAKIPFDVNKLYASEILSILLQQSSENKNLFGDLDGVDVVLQQLAVISSCIDTFLIYIFMNILFTISKCFRNMYVRYYGLDFFKLIIDQLLGAAYRLILIKV